MAEPQTANRKPLWQNGKPQTGKPLWRDRSDENSDDSDGWGTISEHEPAYPFAADAHGNIEEVSAADENGNCKFSTRLLRAQAMLWLDFRQKMSVLSSINQSEHGVHQLILEYAGVHRPFSRKSVLWNATQDEHSTGRPFPTISGGRLIFDGRSRCSVHIYVSRIRVYQKVCSTFLLSFCCGKNLFQK